MAYASVLKIVPEKYFYSLRVKCEKGPSFVKLWYKHDGVKDWVYYGCTSRAVYDLLEVQSLFLLW